MDTRKIEDYPFLRIQRKWQAYWRRKKTFKVTEDPTVPPEKRRYVLDMFPYPSSAGLHVGHPEGYTATDVYCRYLRMNGYAVLHPMGYDSFGLPAENYAIETGTHPRTTTERNIKVFRRQIESLGFSYDWDREIATHKPDYYKWTQWIFLRLFERGLAYQSQAPVWYCEALGTVLANEEVLMTDEGPRSERGGHPVQRRALTQWMLKITAYAERLLEGLDRLDWPESIKAMQRHWIGRSEGAEIDFAIGKETVSVFTTRPDTLFGATYLVLAPEHELALKITTPEHRSKVEQYIAGATAKSDLERTDLAGGKTGVFTGAYATNPANRREIPVWIADYVLGFYGTGSIMAVPAHDQRDLEFARAFKLPVVVVVAPEGSPAPDGASLKEALIIHGRAVNSGPFNDLSTPDCTRGIVAWLEKRKAGRKKVNYKMRDWIFSRQRYWGEPIPVMHLQDGRAVPIGEHDLPLRLPEVRRYKPTGTGKSPLAAIDKWVRVAQEDGREALRETDTMPQWAGSCWYYLRYLDPHNSDQLAAPDKINYWMPVDLYVGGAEHAVLHLLYARFWHKVLYDIGVVNTDEPFVRLVNQGMILGEGGIKMSKSLGNVINPDEIVENYGADSLRIYEMFIGPLRASKPWSTRGLVGVHRFLQRIWRLRERPIADVEPRPPLRKLLHQTIRKVSQDTTRLNFNTALSQLMIFVNKLYKEKTVARELWEGLVLTLSPYAPHLAEELWEWLGNKPPVSLAQWPAWDEALAAEEYFTLVVQVNAKIRAKLSLPIDTPKKELEELALTQERVQQILDGRTPRRVIVIPNKLVNILVD